MNNNRHRYNYCSFWQLKSAGKMSLIKRTGYLKDSYQSDWLGWGKADKKTEVTKKLCTRGAWGGLGQNDLTGPQKSWSANFFILFKPTKQMSYIMNSISPSVYQSVCNALIFGQSESRDNARFVLRNYSKRF